MQQTSPLAQPQLQQKLEVLRALMRSFKAAFLEKNNGEGGLPYVWVAYSGGVDSTLVCKVAYEELGAGMTAVLGVSASLAGEEFQLAVRLAKQVGFPLKRVETKELTQREYVKNNKLRCYYCKQELFSRLRQLQSEALPALRSELPPRAFFLDGSNADELREPRAGRLAATQHQVRSVLAEAQLTKAEVRCLARSLGLPNYDKPASPCLASRLAVGVEVSEKRLAQVERAEGYLRRLRSQLRQPPFRQLRVRHHGALAQVESESVALPFLLARRQQIASFILALGFKQVVFSAFRAPLHLAVGSKQELPKARAERPNHN